MGVERIPFIETPRYHVYALLCEDENGAGYVKFGMSGDIGKRLTSIRQTCPIPAKYFATIEIGYSKQKARLVESELHKRFQDRRITGEWFRFDFHSAEDKRTFNDGCKTVFLMNCDVSAPRWWETMSVESFDEHNRKRKAALVKSGNLRKLIAKRKRDRERQEAWKELAR